MQYKTTSKSITIILPITTPTGKVRVKRPEEGLVAEPVACRSVVIRERDYLEWQISYHTDNLHEPSIVREVELQKDTGTRYGCELVRLLVDGLRLGFISSGQIFELKKAMEVVDKGIEEMERIARKPTSPTELSERYGFTRHCSEVPDYLKSGARYDVEINISHKQRAVGNQAMIYLCLPVQYCRSRGDNPIIGRTADRNELIEYEINRSNAQLIYDVTLAFIIASKKHREDIRTIFDALNL